MEPNHTAMKNKKSVNFCPSKEEIKAYIPDGFTEVSIDSLTRNKSYKKKYIQTSVKTKYNLNTYYQPSIKLILESDEKKCINLHTFGPLASALDVVCSEGDTLVMTGFEVDICPKNKCASGRYQIILDDRNIALNPAIWIIQSSDGDVAATEVERDDDTAATEVEAQNSPKSKRKKMHTYDYTLLEDVKIGTRAHVYGVVAFVKPPKKTSLGSEYYTTVSIVDPSLSKSDDKLTCNLFHDDIDGLPGQAQQGDIIRFHRLKIMSYLGDKQGRSGPGFHWVLFQGSYEQRMASSTKYTLHCDEMDKVDDLLNWWNNKDNWFHPSNGEDTSSKRGVEPSPSAVSPQPGTSQQSPSTSIDLDELPLMRAPVIVYQSLKDVQANTVVNLYGVVIYTKPVKDTVRKEYYLMMNITDSSLRSRDDKLTLNLFDACKDKLPHQASRGDVIRFQHLRITEFGGKKQGVKDQSLHWVLFSRSFNRRTLSSENCIVEDEEEAEVQKLMDWWNRGPEIISFSYVEEKQYFCLVCQVLEHVFIQDKGYVLLKVWDGTKFDGPMLSVSVAGIEYDETLMKIPTQLGLIHHVFIFDDHVSKANCIKPKDFIKLTNLHAAVVSGQVEMTLHGGTSYQRGLRKLAIDDPDVTKLKARLDSLVAETNNLNHNRQDKDKHDPSTSKFAMQTQSAESDKDSRESAVETHDSLSLYSVPSPPSSLNLSERDRYRVYKIIDKINEAGAGKHSEESRNTRVETDGSSASVVDAAQMKGIHDTESSSRCSERVVASIHDNSSSSSSPSPPFSSSSCPPPPPSSSSCPPPPPPSSSSSAARRESTLTRSMAKSCPIRFDHNRRLDSLEQSSCRLAESHETGRNAVVRRSARQRYGKKGTPHKKDREVGTVGNLVINDSCCDKATSSTKGKKNVKFCGQAKPIIEIEASDRADGVEGLNTLPHLDKGISSKSRERAISTTASPRRDEQSEERSGCDAMLRTGNTEVQIACAASTSTRDPAVNLSTSMSQSGQSRPPSTIPTGNDPGTSAAQGHAPVVCVQQQPKASSPARCLSLRSNANRSDLPALTDGSNASCLSASHNPAVKVLRVSQKDIAGEDMSKVSSSGESSRSVPSDGQRSGVADGSDDEQISSSTDAKDCRGERKTDELPGERDNRVDVPPPANERIAAVCRKHANRKCYKLETFRRHGLPTKCKVMARLHNFSPHTGNPKDLVQFCCFHCKHMVSASAVAYRASPITFPTCPNRCGVLEPQIVMDMILCDGDNYVKTALWRENAVEFFQGVTATNLLLQSSSRDYVQQCLADLCPPDTELQQKPLMECCLASYCVRNKLMFQMFDTAMV